MKKLNQNGLGLIEFIVIIVAICLLAGGGYYVYTARKDNTSSNKNHSTTEITKSNNVNDTQSIDNGEAKADYIVSLLKSDSSDATKTIFAELTDSDKYIAYNEKLSHEKQQQRSTEVGFNVGFYGDLFQGGTFTKISNKQKDDSIQLTTTVYEVENPDAGKLYSGTHTLTIKTGYIDAAWRIVDFDVSSPSTNQ